MVRNIKLIFNYFTPTGMDKNNTNAIMKLVGRVVRDNPLFYSTPCRRTQSTKEKAIILHR